VVDEGSGEGSSRIASSPVERRRTGVKSIDDSNLGDIELFGEERCWCCRKPNAQDWSCWIMEGEERGKVRCRTCARRNVGCRWEPGEDNISRKRKRAQGDVDGSVMKRKKTSDEPLDKQEAAARKAIQKEKSKKRAEDKKSDKALTLPKSAARVLDPAGGADEDDKAKVEYDLRRFMASMLVQQQETNRHLGRIASALEGLDETQELYLAFKRHWHDPDADEDSANSSSEYEELNSNDFDMAGVGRGEEDEGDEEDEEDEEEDEPGIPAGGQEPVVEPMEGVEEQEAEVAEETQVAGEVTQ
jgi:hypothetical protein